MSSIIAVEVIKSQVRISVFVRFHYVLGRRNLWGDAWFGRLGAGLGIAVWSWDIAGGER